MKLKKTNIYITSNDDQVIENVAFGPELTVTKEVTDTEENKAHTWYKIIGQPSYTKTSKISFTTTQDNVNISFKIKSSSESGFDYVYLTEIDSTNTQYNSSIVNKVSGNGTEKVVDYTVQKAGYHYIYVCYRKDGSGNSYNDCGYVCLLTKVGIPVTEIKSVYVENSKVQQMNVQGKNLFEYGSGNTISWETLTWDKSNNSYTYNTNGPIRIKYKFTSISSTSETLNKSPSNLPLNGKVYKLDFYPSIISNNTYIMPYKIDLSDWDTSYVLDMESMFNNFYSLNSINLSRLTNENVTSTNSMFYGCKNIETLDVSGFNTSNVTDMYCMFYDCEKLATLDVSGWNTSKVTDIGWMFGKCYLLKSLDVSKWNTGNVTNMYCMFYDCNKLTTLDVSNWNTSKVTDMGWMFYGCNNLATLDVSKWNTGNVTNMYCMFYDCNKLTTLDVSNWNTSKVTDMGWMFYWCNNLATLDVSNWNTSKVTNMENMFCLCNKLKTLDVSNWNTSKVTNMSNMFRGCSSIISLNVSGWNTSNVTNMEKMIWGLGNITSLDVSKWDVSKVTNMDYMFNDCILLESLDLSRWNVSKVTSAEGILGYSPRLKTIIAGHESEPNVTALNGLKHSVYLNFSDNLNYESVYALFRGVATVTTTQTITLPKVMQGKLDATKVKIATDKGWTVAYK